LPDSKLAPTTEGVPSQGLVINEGPVILASKLWETRSKTDRDERPDRRGPPAWGLGDLLPAGLFGEDPIVIFRSFRSPANCKNCQSPRRKHLLVSDTLLAVSCLGTPGAKESVSARRERKDDPEMPGGSDVTKMAKIDQMLKINPIKRAKRLPAMNWRREGPSPPGGSGIAASS
jgi:hypothetical protein